MQQLPCRGEAALYLPFLHAVDVILKYNEVYKGLGKIQLLYSPHWDFFFFSVYACTLKNSAEVLFPMIPTAELLSSTITQNIFLVLRIGMSPFLLWV